MFQVFVRVNLLTDLCVIRVPCPLLKWPVLFFKGSLLLYAPYSRLQVVTVLTGSPVTSRVAAVVGRRRGPAVPALPAVVRFPTLR